MPEYDRNKAVESGFAQVRVALQSFAGDVVSVEEGEWGDGREFLEIQCSNVEVLEVSEELSMEVTEWNFRENCSLAKDSFWMDKFIPSVDKHKLTLPNDLVGKRIVWKKVTKEAKDPQYNSTNFIIDSVKAVAKAAPKVVSRTAQVITASDVGKVEDILAPTLTKDLMELALELAVGKTETQFRSAVSLSPAFVDTPFLGIAKSGLLTKQLVEEGKLVEVKEGNKTVYQKPE